MVFACMPLRISSRGRRRVLHATCICGPVVVTCGCKYPTAAPTCEREGITRAYKKQAQGYVTPLEAVRPFDKKEQNRMTCVPPLQLKDRSWSKTSLFLCGRHFLSKTFCLNRIFTSKNKFLKMLEMVTFSFFFSLEKFLDVLWCFRFPGQRTLRF